VIRIVVALGDFNEDMQVMLNYIPGLQKLADAENLAQAIHDVSLLGR
jgi:hypothetical protein